MANSVRRPPNRLHTFNGSPSGFHTQSTKYVVCINIMVNSIFLFAFSEYIKRWGCYYWCFFLVSDHGGWIFDMGQYKKTIGRQDKRKIKNEKTPLDLGLEPCHYVSMGGEDHFWNVCVCGVLRGGFRNRRFLLATNKQKTWAHEGGSATRRVNNGTLTYVRVPLEGFPSPKAFVRSFVCSLPVGRIGNHRGFWSDRESRRETGRRKTSAVSYAPRPPSSTWNRKNEKGKWKGNEQTNNR